MRAIVAVALSFLIAACAPAQSTPTAPLTPAPTPAPIATPYEYPDLPARIEVTIAEGDCQALETVANFLDRDGVDALVKVQAFEAIAHRSRELGC